MDSIHVLMLGTSLERCTRQLDGGNWPGFHPLSLNILFFCGLFSGMHWSLRRECVDGVTLDALCVCSVEPPKRTENTFSLGVTLVVEFGQISWPSVPFQMLLWVGKLLKLGD